MHKHTTLLLTTACLAALLGACGKAEPIPAAPAAPTASAAPAAPSAVPAAPAAAATAPAAAPAPTATAAPAAPTAPVATAVETGTDAGKRIPAYRNTVRRPGSTSAKAEQFDTQAAKKPTVYIVNSTTCPYCTGYVDRMKEIEKTYMGKGVDVVHVYPVGKESSADKAEHHAKVGFQGGLIDDTEAEFARSLDVNKTPTAILTDAKGTIVYRGRIDDNMKVDRVKVHELAEAIDATLAGTPVTVTTTEPFG